jgi:aspartyl protease family protein
VSGNAPYVVFYIVAALFVASSLIGRRLPVGETAKMALAWIAIFVVAIAIAVFLRAYF